MEHEGITIDVTQDIEALELGERINRPVRSALEAYQLPPTIESLCQITALELGRQPRCGPLALYKIRQKLHDHGLRLIGDDAWDPDEPVDERGRPKKSNGAATSEKSALTTTTAKPAKSVKSTGKPKKPAFVAKPSIRGSSFNAGLTCPGSVFLAQKSAEMNIEQENKYTNVGTMGHRYLELRMTAGEEAAERYFDSEGVSDEFRVEVRDFWDWLEESEILPALSSESARERGVLLQAENALQYQAGGVLITGTLDLVEIVDGHGIVCDWKFYNRPDMLPEIENDMQMIAYAVGAWQKYNIDRVTVHRFLCYHNQVDTVEFADAEMLKIAHEAVTEEAESIWNRRNELNPGAQCRSCFQSWHCPAMETQFQAVETSEIAPYEGGEFSTKNDVLNFLLAVPLVEQRIKEGIAAAKRFVESIGEPVVDLTSNMQWGPSTRQQDTIVDPAGCLAQLMLETSQEEALRAAKTSKKAMEDVLKAAGKKPKERKAFLADLRDSQLLVKQETSPRWEWKKIKSDT